MLQITLPPIESWDGQKEEFITVEKEKILQLEHSLVSIAKWESKWHKPFISKTPKTDEEVLDYVKCMTITQNVNPDVYNRLTLNHISMVHDYINESMTATTFSDAAKGKSSREVITAEIIYYWMIALNIPHEYQKWHLNRLLTLIQVCNIKNTPAKKMSKRDIMSRNAALNAARKKQFNTRG